MAKLSDLKMKNIRKVIAVDVDGEIQIVTIKNIMGAKRNKYIEEIANLIEDQNSQEEINDAIYTKLFTECTDLEIDEDVMEVLNNPTGAMLQIMREVMEMLHELQCEIMFTRLLDLNNLEESLYSQLLLLKANTISEVTKEIKGYEKNIEKNEVIRERAEKRKKLAEKKENADADLKEIEEIEKVEEIEEDDE